jgi:ubiquinone/menaquinone biosynthesis C-methylase UbiE
MEVAMDVERNVAAHYDDAALGERLLGALAAAGLDIEHLSADTLAPVDEFHIGGRQATVEFAAQFGVRATMRLLDVGSGIGGPARYFAAAHGCQVTGIDLTEAFVRVARDLTRRAGLSRSVSFHHGSALALPFERASFDGAYMIHVGMNIEDKAKLFTEVRGVLKPGGSFGIFDLMRTGEGDLVFPVPWSSRPETSFVVEVVAYRKLLEAAGFTVLKQRVRRDFALAFFREMQAKAAAAKASGQPMLGTQLIMGADFPNKMRNAIEGIERGLIAPVEQICRAG